MTDPRTMDCSHCGTPVKVEPHFPEPDQLWCSRACCDAYYVARPEGAIRWVEVEDLTTVQRAELDAFLGQGKPC